MSRADLPEEDIHRDEETRALMSLFRRLRHQMRRPGTVESKEKCRRIGYIAGKTSYSNRVSIKSIVIKH